MLVARKGEPQMKMGDVFPSKYLRAEDLEEDLVVTMGKVTMEEMTQKYGPRTEKPVLHFKELDKALVINKTNWALIAKQHGEESDAWEGKRIVLTVVDVDSFGDVVAAIRVRAPRKGRPGTRVDPVVETGDT